MQDCRDGKLDLIITKSVSRFGRNTLDCLKSVRELKSLNVDVYFEKENIHTMRSDGELLLTLMSAVAENESFTQSENVKWGIRRRYEQGHVQSVPSGGKFLGYVKGKDGRLEINEEQAGLVKRIYQMFLNGYGTFQIAEILNTEGVPTSGKRGHWEASMIMKILTNEKMKGDTLCLKTYNADPLTKHRVKNTGELPQQYYEGTHPAIIDQDTWECVRLELIRQEQYCKAHSINRYHNSREKHPLSGKITCASCGRTYMQLCKGGRTYWRCSSFLGGHGTVIEGRAFIPKPRPLRSKSPDNSQTRYRGRHRKLPVERQMLCTDIQIPAGEPERAFVQAWNALVDRYMEIAGRLEEIIQNGDSLQCYRARELMRLNQETGRIDRMLYELMLKVLDHIEVREDGRIEVVFFTRMNR